ncbi:MAG: ribose 5-phosphate isomerase B [Tannerella sp.]|jgi:ribose 5-phosphate isomerase B|nr:ribose 5-phosphate isomerase B [Tannerella sp.]
MNFSNQTIGLTSDHAGYELKEAVKKHLEARNIQYRDFGTTSPDRCDYPDYARLLADAISSKDLDMGIAICGTGNGMAMTLNKYPTIRAGLAWNVEVARLVGSHNKANILVLPARFVTTAEAVAMIDVWLATPFEGGRHQERIDKISG